MNYRGGSFSSFAPAGSGNMNGRRGAVPAQKNLSVDDSLGFVNEDGEDGTAMPPTISGNGINRPRPQMMQAQQQQMLMQQQQQMQQMQQQNMQPIGYGASPARPRPMPMQQGRPGPPQMMMPGAMPTGAPGPRQGGFGGGPGSPGPFQQQPQQQQQFRQQQMMPGQMQMPQPQMMQQGQGPMQQQQMPQSQQMMQQPQMMQPQMMQQGQGQGQGQMQMQPQQQQAVPQAPVPVLGLPSGAAETEVDRKLLALQERIAALEGRVASGSQASTVVQGDVGLVRKELQTINADLLAFNKRMDGYRDESKWFFCVVADNPDGHVKLYENYLKPAQEAATVPCGDFLLMHYPMKSSGDDVWIKCRVINPADAQLQTFWVKAYDGATRKRLVDNFGFTPKSAPKPAFDPATMFTQDPGYMPEMSGAVYPPVAPAAVAPAASSPSPSASGPAGAGFTYKETPGHVFTNHDVTEIPSAAYDARLSVSANNNRDTLTSMFAGSTLHSA